MEERELQVSKFLLDHDFTVKVKKTLCKGNCLNLYLQNFMVVHTLLAISFSIYPYCLIVKIYNIYKLPDTFSEFYHFIKTTFPMFKCQRPYHVEYTSSRPITEVKQH